MIIILKERIDKDPATILLEAETREEFTRRLRANLERPDGIAAAGTAVGARIDWNSVEDRTEPAPDLQYFYAAELV